MSDQGNVPPSAPEPSSAAYPSSPPPAPGYDGGAYGAPAPGYQNAAPGAPVEKPKTIALAVKLMYAGAALSVLGALSTLLQQDTIREAVETASRDAGTTLTGDEIDLAVAVGTGTAVVAGLIGVLLWIFMAIMNGKGKKWARIVATVFFGLNVATTLSSLVQSQPALSLVLSVISLALGAYILFLLYRPESSRFYEAASAPKY